MSLNDFILIDKIGKGSFTVVWKVKRRVDGKVYALKQVKILEMGITEQQHALDEVRFLASITHPCVIAFKEVFYDFHTKSLCLLLEYAPAGDLRAKIKAFASENERFSHSFL